MGRILTLINGLAAFLEFPGTILYRRRVERELQSLSDVMLKDIGVTRSEIPWIAVTQAKWIRAQASTGLGQLKARDRRHTLSLIPSQLAKE